jgi:glutamate dehydrogenase/leucine dehydrogenase
MPGDRGESEEDLFQRLGAEYEQVVYCHDPACGLKAIVAIHSTVLGPALGGTRFYPYPDSAAALTDVLRLAKGMTYKSALAGLDLGGGKAVIIGDPATAKTERLLRTYARFVDSLGGRYLTAEDVGTTQADMDVIARETRCVTGTSPELGGSGDPSEATAHGVYWAMKAAAAHLDGSPNLAGVHVVVSGVGKVGSGLIRLLLEDGASVSVADIDPGAVARLTADPDVEVATLPPATAHATECDFFAPCALGAVLNQRTIPELRCRAIVGAANNQLETDEDAVHLAERGIVYVPDFVANAGGVINIADELIGYDRARAIAGVERISATTADVLRIAAADAVTTVRAAESIAEERIRQARATRGIRSFAPPARRGA